MTLTKKSKRVVPQSNELGPLSVSPNLLRRQSVENVTLFFFKDAHKRSVGVVRHSNESHPQRNLSELYLRVMN